METASQNLIQILNKEINEFSVSDPNSYQPIIDKIGDARIVLMGEASHGTEEFYQARIELSKYLISKKNFHAIAIPTCGNKNHCSGAARKLRGLISRIGFTKFFLISALR